MQQKTKKIPGGHAKLSDISVTIKLQAISVEKSSAKFPRKIRIILFAGMLLFNAIGRGQKMQMIKGYCGIYYKTMADLKHQKKAELDFYQFRPGQTVASIGAQCCHWEAAFAAASDSLHFFLQDIDTTYFNRRQAGFAWAYYDSLRGKPMTSVYSLIIGTETETKLPGNRFDKVIIINTFHEFSSPDKMLADIKTKLRPGGLLYIDESVPKKRGQLHGVCKKRMLMPDEMDDILNNNGFEPAGSVNILFREGKTYRRIYAYRIKPLS